MEIHPKNQIEAISEFRSNTGGLLKKLTRLKTLLLTQHGKTCAVLVDPQAYEDQLDRLRLAESIMRGEKEIEAGQGVLHADVEQLSKSWL